MDKFLQNVISDAKTKCLSVGERLEILANCLELEKNEIEKRGIKTAKSEVYRALAESVRDLKTIYTDDAITFFESFEDFADTNGVLKDAVKLICKNF